MVAEWFARMAVAAVFVVNVQAALQFLLSPGSYTSAFQIEGAGAETTVQAVGVLFLMWNATHPLVILDPRRHRTLFSIVVLQQAIALTSDVWLRAALPAGSEMTARSIGRFAAFDGAGLVLMTLAFTWVSSADITRYWGRERGR